MFVGLAGLVPLQGAPPDVGWLTALIAGVFLALLGVISFVALDVAFGRRDRREVREPESGRGERARKAA